MLGTAYHSKIVGKRISSKAKSPAAPVESIVPNKTPKLSVPYSSWTKEARATKMRKEEARKAKARREEKAEAQVKTRREAAKGRKAMLEVAAAPMILPEKVTTKAKSSKEVAKDRKARVKQIALKDATEQLLLKAVVKVTHLPEASHRLANPMPRPATST